MFERFTERARQVVVLAQEEARTLKHNYIGTEHILLGLLREQEGLAAHVLESLGITVERVRTLVIRIVGRGEELTSGQIQYAYDVEATNLPALRADSSLVVNVEPSLSFAMLVPNTAKAPLNNTDVRLAIEYGIDRQALSDAVQGKGVGQRHGGT